MLKYITKIKINFCPFNQSSKSARLFLSRVGNSACELTNPQCQIETKVQSDLKAPSSIFIKFKDGKEFNLNAEKLSIDDIFQVVNKETRKLALLDESK